MYPDDDTDGDDGGLFVALDRHATMVADREFKMPKEVSMAFMALQKAVESNWGVRPNANPTSPVGRACTRFMYVAKKTYKKN